MNPFAVWRFVRNLWNRKDKKPTQPRKSPQRKSFRLHLEALEERTVMSTLPAPVIADQYNLLGQSSVQMAVDPLNPQRIVAVAGNGGLAAAYTDDGGVSWSPFSIPTSGMFGSAADASVTFDGQGYFHIAAIEYNGTLTNRTAGQVVVHSFDWDQDSAPSILNFDGEVNWVYRWSGVDPAYNTSIGADTNILTWTDPEDNSLEYEPTTLSESTQNLLGRDVPKALYVAWNNDWTSTGSQTMIAATPYGNSDAMGGDDSAGNNHAWTTVQRVSGIGGAAPQIIFPQKSPNEDIPPGLMAIFYQTTGGSVMLDITQPDGGNAGQQVASTAYFSANAANLGTFADAIEGTGTDANGQPNPDIASSRDYEIDVTLPAGMTTINDMDVKISFSTTDDVITPLLFGDLSTIEMVLTPPASTGLAPITLLRNRLNTRGQTRNDANNQPVGLPVNTGRDFGVMIGGEYFHTVFDDDAPRSITQPGFNVPFAGHFRPEGSGVLAPGGVNFFGQNLDLDADDFNGTWTLTITDHRNNRVPVTTPPTHNPDNILHAFEIHFTGIIEDGMDQSDQTVAGGRAVAASGGSNFSVAQDTTVGLNSPYSGRIYVATSTGDIFVNSADEIIGFGGNYTAVFGAAVQVNDDVPQDNFSEGNRDQYLPAIGVDRSTGTLVVIYNDARWDAANLRYTTMISTSLDGGDTFAPSTWLNQTKTATDFLTGNTVEIEPIPGNNGGSTAISGAGALGRRNAVNAYQGKVVALFGSNENDGANQTWTGRISIAAGPRVVRSDMGTITSFQTVTDDRGTGTTADDVTYTYNDSYTTDGVRQLTGFYLEFDRPIDVMTLNPEDVQVEYRDPFTSTDLPATDATITIDQIIALDGANTFGQHDIGGDGSLATRFLLLFSQPQSRVGTYSYAISPMIRDKMRDPFGRIVPGQVASFEPQGAQQNITFTEQALGNGDIAVSTIDLTAAGLTPARLRDLTVEVNIQHARSSRLLVELIAPGSQGSIVLHDDGLFPSGSNFTNTVFDGAALTDIDDASPPFTGVFRPEGTIRNGSNQVQPETGMEAFIKRISNVNGVWTLRVTNEDGSNGGTLVTWKLNLQTGQTETLATGIGNYMDQNSDGWSADGALSTNSTSYGIRESASRQQSGDRYAVPNPVSGVPFQLPYTVNSLPLMISGPKLEHTARNEVQSVSVMASGGNYTLTLPNFGTTGNIAWNASAATVRTALENIGGIGNLAGRFAVTRTQVPGSFVYQVQYTGAFAGQDMPPLTWNNVDLVSGTVVISTMTAGTRGTNVPGFGKTSEGENLVLNTTVNQIEFEFDRMIDVSTFTAADVVEVIGPYGRVNLGVNNANVTVTPVNEVAGFAKVFRVSFPVQELSGSYSVVLGSDIQDRLGFRIDNNQNAGLDVLRGTNPTNAALSSGTYSRNNLNLVFNPDQTTTFDLDVPNSFLIAQSQGVPIEFTFNLTHPDVRDLSAQLVSPNGTVITLFNNLYTFNDQPGPSAATANMQNVTLNDFATEIIQDGAPPYNSGIYKPTQSLGTFVGEQAQGTWQLRITNASASLVGILESFQLKLPRVIPGSGVGEAVGDRGTGAFRIFVGDPSNDIVRENWTAVGPQTNSNKNSGRVGAIAVDPSDPSGNTVFAAGATGGIWKTTNFLTTDPQGPTWIPLTDFGPNMAMPVSHIATYARNNNPNETIVVVSTGDNDELTWNGGPNIYQQPNRYPGIGMLISFDGGINWKILDSTNNGNPDGSIKSINDMSRDRLFVGTKVNKVIFDPTPLSDGNIVMYAAVTGIGGNAINQRGVWRSLDTGNTWVRMSGVGDATDIVLAAASDVGTGQLNILYAGIQGQGVYFSQNATTDNPTMTILGGGAGNPLRVDGPGGAAIPVTNPGNTPSGNKSRILLAAPPKATGNFLQDTFYQGWLYALVISSTGTFDGLYMTKDFGQNWTDVKIPGFVSGNDTYPTNDESKAEVDLFRGDGSRISSLTIDPNNPNVVYIGGNLKQDPGYTEAFIRLDVTTISDPYAVVAFDNSDPGAGPTQAASVGAVTASSFTYGIRDNYNLLADPIGNYYNMMRHPINQFDSNSEQVFSNVSAFNNEGTDIRWTQFNHFYDGSEIPDTLVTMPGFGFNRAIAITDQFTGKTRLIVGSFDGVYTAVDDGEGNLHTGAGFYTPIKGSRTGNLQLTQFTAGAIQPSSVAADAANSLFYGIAVGMNITASSDNIMNDGLIDWVSRYGGAEMVITDPTGTGRTFQFRWPSTINQNPFSQNEFFIITRPNQNPISFTTGLIQAANPTQWPVLNGSAFAVSPIDNRSLVVSSSTGRIFRATPANANGTQWFEIAAPLDLNSTYASALAFGAPATYPTSNPADFIYAGTENGRVYVTFNGGGIGTAWKDLGDPDPTDNSAILSIQANPKANSSDLYVVTRNGVFYMADSRAASPTWTDITGNLFSLQRAMFNDPSEMINILQPNSLSDLVADWRFAVPDNLAVPNGPTHPVLYVSGWGGVFRSIDKGVTWKYFPNADQGATQQGGFLPAVDIRDLDIAVGNTNTTSGFPDQSTGLNMLVAFTYGRGAYAIKLDNSDVNSYLVIPNSGPRVKQITPISPNPGTSLTGIRVEFFGSVDPISFTAADVISVMGPNGAVTVQNVVDSTPTPPPGQANKHNIYDVFFTTPQSMGGQYTLNLDVNITDYSGNKLNTDNDSINGEVPQDRYTGSINFVVNQPPDLKPVTTPVLATPGQPITVKLDVSDPTDPLSSLVFNIINNSNQALVPNANVAFSFNATTQEWSVTLTPANSNSGTVILTLGVTDPFGLNDTNDTTPPRDNEIETVTVNFDQAPTLVVNPLTVTTPHGVQGSTNYTITDPEETANASSTNFNYYARVVVASTTAVTLDNTYGLIGNTFDPTNYQQNLHIAGAKWIYNSANSAFALFQNGQLWQYTGAGAPQINFVNNTSPNMTLRGTLENQAYWLAPALLTDAANRTSPLPNIALNSGMTFTQGIFNTGGFNGASYYQANGPTNTLNITPPVSFVGQFVVATFIEDVNALTSAVLHQTAVQYIVVNSTNTAPTLAAINDVTTLHDTPTSPPITFTGNDADAADVAILTYHAQVAVASQQAVTLDQSLGLTQWTAHPNDAFNLHGINEKWLNGAGGSLYVIFDDGELRRYVGGPILKANMQLVATLDRSYWLDPSLLYNAQTRTTAVPSGVNFVFGGVNNNELTITPPAGYVGSFVVRGWVSDGVVQTSRFFKVFVTNQAPTLNAINDVTTLHDTPTSPPITFTASDADSDTLTYHAQVAVASQQAVTLDQSLGLTQWTAHPNDAFNLHGINEKWLNGAGGSLYVIFEDGELRRYVGGPILKANMQLVATLDRSYWLDPSLLYNAQSRTTAVPSGVNFVFGGVNGNELTITPPAGYVGSFVVRGWVSDGVVQTSRFFKVFVTNQAPTLNAINDVTTLHDTPTTPPITFTASDPDSGDLDNLTYHAQVAVASQQAVGLDQSLGLTQWTAHPNDAFNLHGMNEKWVNGSGGAIYAIFEDGELRRYVGGPILKANMQLTATLDRSYWLDPSLLYNAQSRTAAVPQGVGFAFTGANSNELTITPPAGYVGSFVVRGWVSDGVVQTSRFFKVTVTNQAPTLNPFGNVSAIHDTQIGPITYTFNDADSGDLDNLTIGAQVAVASQQAVGLDSSLGLTKWTANANDAFNIHGMNEKWINGSGGALFAIFEDGELRRYVGGPIAKASMQLIATLDRSYWLDPSLLYNAQSRTSAVPAGVGFNFSGNDLTITPPVKYVGSFVVRAFVTDGAATTNRFFLVTFTNTAPTVTVSKSGYPNNAASYNMTSGGPFDLNVAISNPDADGDPVTTQVTVSNVYNLAYELDKQYDFFNQYPGPNPPEYNFNFYGQQEKWVRSRVNGQPSNHYAIFPDGSVYRIVANPANPFGEKLGTLGVAYYNDPSLLWNAFDTNAVGTASAQLMSGNTLLRLTTSAGFVGHFDVTLTLSDGIVNTIHTFRVNVSG